MNKKFILIFYYLFFQFQIFSIENYDILVENEDYKLEVLKNSNIILYGELDKIYSFKIENKLNQDLNFGITNNFNENWNIRIPPITKLKPLEIKILNISLKFKGPIENYVLKEEKENYILLEVLEITKGDFDFDFFVNSKNPTNFKLDLKVDKDYLKSLTFNPILEKNSFNIGEKFSIELIGPDISKREDMELNAYLKNEKLEKNFKVEDLGFSTYKYHFKLPKDLSLKTYDLKFILDYNLSDVKNREFTTQIFINPSSILEVVDISNKSFSFWTFKKLKIENKGNLEETYFKRINLGFFESLAFSSNIKLLKDETSSYFEIKVGIGKSIILEYKYDYSIFLTIIFLTIFLIGLRIYIYLRIPIDCEIQITEIKRSSQLIETAKIKIRLENNKQKDFKNSMLILKIPIYIKLFEDSFLTSKPDKILKGRNFYKLVWNFDHFKSFETRYIGFMISNEAKIIGNIELPKLEINLTNENEIQKSYYLKFDKLEY
jgi:hypothetical protein